MSECKQARGDSNCQGIGGTSASAATLLPHASSKYSYINSGSRACSKLTHQCRLSARGCKSRVERSERERGEERKKETGRGEGSADENADKSRLESGEIEPN